MQNSLRKLVDRKSAKVKSKTVADEAPDLSKKYLEDKILVKKNTIATPRSYTNKTSTTDIYGLPKKSSTTSSKIKLSDNATKSTGGKILIKKTTGTKDSLRKAASNTTQKAESAYSTPQQKIETPKVSQAGGSTYRPKKYESPRTGKDLPFVNVTVNSPLSQRKHPETKRKDKNPTDIKTNHKVNKVESLDQRQRSKTRTLDEHEVKVLTPQDAIDNNAEMKKLARKLVAKPKAFFIDIDEGKKSKEVVKPKPAAEKSSDDDNQSYEDDFDSYESDFNSYHSMNSENDNSSKESHDSEQESHTDFNETQADEHCNSSRIINNHNGVGTVASDEEKMLDSGSFDLREAQKSATKVKAIVMDGIVEDSEDGDDYKNRISLTDEGFQEMSSNSAVSSIKVTTNEEVERPTFINFTKSRQNKKRRLLNEFLKRRTDELLNMITLHEVAYTLFEMKPIPYDSFMMTFGKSNYTQCSSQTYDDGIVDEIQTETVYSENKWTQYPIEFSQNDICTDSTAKRIRHRETADNLNKFTFLYDSPNNTENVTIDESYKNNPLRIYLDQKDGVGADTILPYADYEKKLKSCNWNAVKLGKFLNKFENRIHSILSRNSGRCDDSECVKKSKWPFTSGYRNLMESVTCEEFSFLNKRPVSGVVFSETKQSLLMTVHNKILNGNVTDLTSDKCVICLWDVSVANEMPIKVLIAIDNARLCKFQGNADGVFVSALEDGSIHLWDLSEDATWVTDPQSVASTPAVPVEDKGSKTATEMDREWNAKYGGVASGMPALKISLRSCAYTSSASVLRSEGVAESLSDLVGLELVPREAAVQENGRKLIGQVCSLERRGVLRIWSIIQERGKFTTPDLGKAYWSKTKLQSSHTVMLAQHVDYPVHDMANTSDAYTFNLSTAKRRLTKKRSERNSLRPKTGTSTKSDSSTSVARLKSARSLLSDSSSSVASERLAGLSDGRVSPDNWESGILCTDLKVLCLDRVEHYLVARNCGEVLCYVRGMAGKVKRFAVANNATTITVLEVSPIGLPYFLAGTDTGTIHLFTVRESRVLLSLDTRTGPASATPAERYLADYKGRFLGSVPVKPAGCVKSDDVPKQASVQALQWLKRSACSFLALTAHGVALWDLAHSDIHARFVGPVNDVVVCKMVVARGVGDDGRLAILTSEGAVELHRLCSDKHSVNQEDLFVKYVSLL